MNGLIRDGYNIELISRDQVLRREQRRSAHHEQDWQAYQKCYILFDGHVHT